MFKEIIRAALFIKLVAVRYACITLPMRFLRSGDRRDRRLTGSMTVLTVLTVRVFC